LHYQLGVIYIQNITGIHIHQGKSGENGTVIVNLYEPKENISHQNGTKLTQLESSSVTIGGNTQSFFVASGTIIIQILKNLYLA